MRKTEFIHPVYATRNDTDRKKGERKKFIEELRKAAKKEQGENSREELKKDNKKEKGKINTKTVSQKDTVIISEESRKKYEEMKKSDLSIDEIF